MSEKEELEQERIGLFLAMGLYSAIILIGLADGELADSESMAAFHFLLPLSSQTGDVKSKVLTNASWAIVNQTEVVKSVWSQSPEPKEDYALIKAYEVLVSSPESDRYRYHVAVEKTCIAVGEASGGGLLKRNAFSESEQKVMVRILTMLWSGKPNKAPDKKYDAFAAAARKFVATNGF